MSLSRLLLKPALSALLLGLHPSDASAHLDHASWMKARPREEINPEVIAHTF